MMIRSTTNGVLKSYRYNLQRSSYTLNKAMNTVLTGRNFDTYAADPATAARCFQMRRSFQRANSQYSVSESVVRKYDQAWSALGSVVDDINNQKTSSAYQDILNSINDPTASGRNALGQSLTELAKGIVQTMNGRYGDNFIFAGADGLKVPFTWGEDGTLCYRGVPVDAAVPDVAMSNGAPLTLNDQGQYDPAGTNYLLAGEVKTISVDDYEAAVKAGNAPTVLRDTTERPEGIAAGTLKLAGTDEGTIYTLVRELLTDREEYARMSHASNPYGDGLASARIAGAILAWKRGRA